MSVEIVDCLKEPGKHAEITMLREKGLRGKVFSKEMGDTLFVSVGTGVGKSKRAVRDKFVKAISYAAAKGYGDVVFNMQSYAELGMDTDTVYGAVVSAHDSLYDELGGQLSLYLCTENSWFRRRGKEPSGLRKKCMDFVAPISDRFRFFDRMDAMYCLHADMLPPDDIVSDASEIAAKEKSELASETDLEKEDIIQIGDETTRLPGFVNTRRRFEPDEPFDMSADEFRPVNRYYKLETSPLTNSREDFAGVPRPPVAASSSVGKKQFPDALGETFSQMLVRLIIEKDITEIECYKKANIDKKLFSKIRSNRDYNPTKKTVISFALALELTLDETKDFLLRAGYALSPSIAFDAIVMEYISNGKHNVFELNETLYRCGIGTLSDRKMYV